MRNLMLAAAIVGALSISGAAQVHDDHHGAASGSEAQRSMMPDCPMKVEGVSLAVTNTNNGIALAITTRSGDVTELRRRVEKMAKMHSAASGGHMMPGGMISFTAKYEDIPDGARLTFTPAKAGELEELRSQVRKHAEQMKTGECGMMQHMMGGMPGFAIPAVMKAEHDAIHSELENLTRAGGRTGEAAKGVVAVLEKHFAKENEYALPPLSLLVPLSEGKFDCGMTAVLPLTETLKGDMLAMLSEHKQIVAALRTLNDAATAENKPAGIEFAEHLTAHAQQEEEITYPSALLVGMYVKSRAAQCPQ